jgi:prenyl protein peptidase
VLFQFAYTTAFGWLATWAFLSTGHAAAPALMHAACNAMGVPPFGAIARARHAGRPLLLWATAAGAAAFGWAAAAVMRPELYANTVYAPR